MVECEEEPVSEVEAIQRSLEEAEEKARQAVARQQQLDELASKLTEWNSKLEQKVTELEVDLIRKDEELLKQRLEFEQQLVEITEKRIQLLQEYSQLEEDHLVLRRSATEQEDVLLKVWQENRSLKSKLASCLSPRLTFKLDGDDNLKCSKEMWQEIDLADQPPSSHITQLLRKTFMPLYTNKQ